MFSLIDTETNNWFPTNQLVCDHVFSLTGEQKDRNICRLQGFFFPACSVQPLQSAVTQPETARCRPAQTQPEQSMYAQSSERRTPSSTLRCLFNPSLPGVTGSLRSNAFRLPVGGVTVPQAGSINTRSERGSNQHD